MYSTMRLRATGKETNVRRGTLSSSWLWLLSLFTLAGFIETVFWGQMNSFTPLYLPRLGIAPGDVATWTGATVAISGALGIPFLPFWGALADRYSRKPVIVRSFVAHLVAGVIALLAGNIWVFVLGRAVMSLALGNSGLMMTTLEERVPEGRLDGGACLRAPGDAGALYRCDARDSGWARHRRGRADRARARPSHRTARRSVRPLACAVLRCRARSRALAAAGAHA